MKGYFIGASLKQDGKGLGAMLHNTRPCSTAVFNFSRRNVFINYFLDKKAS